jgi:adenylate cyclase
MITSYKLLVEKLNRLIDAHLDDPAITVNTLCRSLGLSRSQLHRTVKEQSSLSTSLYIRQRRLLKAHDLLLTTEWRIAEISDRVGFSNAHNSSTYFTEEFTLSPTEFRKQQAQLSPSPLAVEPLPGPAEQTQPGSTARC